MTGGAAPVVGRDAMLSRRTLNRNWDELMQELRAAQTGVQILTGFLVTVPLSSRFGGLVPFQRGTYLAVLAGAVTATCLIPALWVVAPLGLARFGAFPTNRPPDEPLSCGRLGRGRAEA